MDQLPSELVVMILPYLNGPDFIHIRRTSKRFKSISDDLEINSKPALWRWYVLSDFPRPSVESMAPWFYTEDKNDAFVWKMLYTSLRRMSLLRGTRLHWRNLLFDYKAVNLAKDVKFFDKHLFLFESTNKVKLVGLDQNSWQWPETLAGVNMWKDVPTAHTAALFFKPVAEMCDGSTILTLLNKGQSSPYELILQGKVRGVRRSNLNWTFTRLPEVHDTENGNVYFSTWTTRTLLYHTNYDNSGLAVISVYKEGISQKLFDFYPTAHCYSSVAFNEKWIVCACPFMRMCIIPIRDLKASDEVILPTHGFEAVKVKMLGDFIIVLSGGGQLATARIWTDVENRTELASWDLLIGHNPHTSILQQTNAVADFAIHGQVFCAVTVSGKVFLSHFESLDHESLKRNLHSPFTIPLANNRSLVKRISLDASDGLKIAVMEVAGVPDEAKLHVLYLDKC
ncbi:hypothetical protein BsWGS_13575 [Bradybaena similaris]